ncbi:MAG: methyltransferase domain-containing protein [Bacteroidetes bacterium]|nr:methyltransferase domain-containing protein [Bacteroidota bacterium]MBS1541600.1 methyltransferase domain-containing protein [Bacteroidota bacterium]
MKLDQSTLPYLRGEKFSNALHIHYPYYETIPDRIRLITEIAKDKKVIHLGCLDHLPLIEQKVKAGKWLHQEITKHSKKCLGIDIERETLAYVQEKYGVTNVILRDMTGEPIPEITAESWDYAVLGELLEHINNPVHYLSEIKKKYSSSIHKIVITVPNVMSLRIMGFAANSTEVINTDHRYWFTPYTIAKVMHHAGIELDELLFANRIKLPIHSLIKQKIIKIFGGQPKYGFQYASSIVAIGKLR